jgi:enoyl-CoA hydratase/carnithine racemase
VPAGVAADLALTARVVRAPEAAQLRLVSGCYDSQAALMTGVMALAVALAAKSPLAIAGTKRVLLHTR